MPSSTYRFVEHARYLDAWFDALGLDSDVTLVCHDWGSALAFHWAHRYPERVAGIAYMEAIVQSLTWEQWPDAARRVFQGFRSDAGEQMVLDNNVFVERVLPGSIIRDLTDDEMDMSIADHTWSLASLAGRLSHGRGIFRWTASPPTWSR